MQSVCQDISEHKKAVMELQSQTKELEQRDAEYLDVLDSAFDGSWVVDCKKGTIQCSEQWAKRIGLDQIPENDRLVYTHTLIHPDDKINTEMIYDCFKSKKTKFDLEYRIKSVDKDYIWTQNRGKITYDKTGDPLKVYAVTMDISKRKEYELNLLKKEQEYLEIIDSSSEGSFIRDLNKEEIYFSGEWKKRLGIEHLSPKEAANAIDSLVHPEDRAGIRSQFLHALQKRKTKIKMEFRMKTVDLGYIWILGQGKIIYDREGKPVKYFGTHMDVTERKKMEEDLRESEEKYRRIITTANEGITMIDVQDRHCFVNEKLAGWLGYSVEEMLGRKVYDFIFEDNIDIAVGFLERRKKGINERYDLKLRKKDKSSIWVSVSGSPLYDKDGNYRGGLAMFTDITERKQMEFELKESKDRYQALIEANVDFIWEMDALGRYTYCSPQMEKLWGLKPADMIGKTPFDLMPADVRECALEVFTKNVNYPGKISKMEITSYDGQGNLIFIEISRVPFFDDLGVLLGYRGITRDITECKITEQALKENEERFRAYVTASSDMIYCMNPDWSEMRQLIGKGILSNTEVSDKNWLQKYIHPDDQPRTTTVIKNAIREKSIFELEHRVLHKDSSLGWTYSRVVPLMNAEGEIVEWFGAAADITARKKTEAALLESEKQYRELIENSPAAIYEIDAQKERFIFVNDAVCQLTGYSREELLSMNHLDILDERSKIAFQSRVSQWFKGARPDQDVDYKVIGKDGREIYALLNVTFTTDENGRPLRATVISQDITCRKQVEQILREKEKRQAFLLKLSDSIMMLTDPIDIQCMAALTLGYHLGVDRSFFGEIVIKDGIEYYSVEHIYHLPSAPLPPGLYPFEGFRKLADENRAGRNIVVYDLETYPLIKEDERLIFRSYNVRSWVSIPLFKYGKFVAVFTVHHTTPRMWTAAEIELIEETAERTWVAVERARVEAALRESENLLSTVLENSRDGISMLDLTTGRYVFMNHAQTELTGFSKNEIDISFKEICKWVHPEDRDIYVELHNLMAAGYESVYNVEYRWQVKSGAYRWFSGKRKLVRDANGKPNAIVGITRDITEQKKAETVLVESERKYRELVKYAPTGICEVDFRSNRFISVNDVICEMTGYSREELMKINNFSLLDEQSKTILRKRISKWLNGEEPDRNVDYKIETKDGQGIYASLNVSCIRDEDGKPVGANIIAHDITERKKMEKALSDSEEKYRTLFNSMDEGFCIIEIIFDAQGKPCDWQHLEVNPAFERQTGLSNVSGQYISNLIPEIEENWFEFFGKVAVTGVPESFENEFKAINRWFEAYAFKTGGQDSRKVAVIFNDITERKKSDKKNLELIEQLRQSDQNKTSFLNMLSHELRNPLASIMMSLSLQDQVYPGGEEDLKARKVMGRQTAHLSRLVDDLLDVTRITQNKITLKKERVELKQLVKLALADYQASFTEKEVGLKFDLTPDLLYLEADPARLTQVIGNLLHNASKFTSKGDHVLVKVCHDESAQEAIISIQDNGIGIKPEILPKMFEPFTQVDNTLDRSNGGLGLGLAIVKGMVELHKGSVSAYSEGLGKGTRLNIRLPLTAVEAGKKEQESQTGGLSANPFKILIIDDIPDIAEILCSLLGYLGYEVAAAFNGPEGIAKAREFRPEVIICDIGLPGMNGYEVAGSLRSDQELKDTFLIALSGYAQAEDLERSREAGFNTHLAKPVNLETLQQVLAEVSLCC